jgi:hypothetical protein
MVIGLAGRARVGKDTFGEMLIEELYSLFRRKYIMMAYATVLKQRVQADFDMSYEQLWGNEKEVPDKRYPKGESFWTPREILQFMGTDCFRAVDYSFWVKSLFRLIEEKEYKNVVITDIRFPNEADPVVERGGFLVHIERPNKDSIHGEQHASETSMDGYDKYDFRIMNDGSLEDLRATAKEVAKIIEFKEKNNG